MNRTTKLHWNPSRPFEINSNQSEVTSSSYFVGMTTFMSFLILFVFCFITMSMKPLLVLIFIGGFFSWKIIYLRIIHRNIFLNLRRIANAAQLVDYDQRRRTVDNRAEVVQSAIFDYYETREQITLAIWPNGIQNSDKVEKLAKLLSVTFNTLMARVNSNRMDCVVYRGYKNNGQLRVDNNDF